jgi:hypothetical protein
MNYPRPTKSHSTKQTFMKYLAISFFAVTGFVVSCKPADKTSTNRTRNATATQFDKIKQEAKRTAFVIDRATQDRRGPNGWRAGVTGQDHTRQPEMKS